MANEGISLVGLDKAAVLAALYNASKPQGMGFMHYDPKPMTTEEAAALLKQTTRFDYLQGRVMKIDLSGGTLDPWGYDRDNGRGAVQRVIDNLKAEGNANSIDIQALHTIGRNAAARDVMAHIHEPSTTEVRNGMPTATLGLADVAEHLIPKTEKYAEQD